MLPLFRPFRHFLGIDSLALADLLYQRAKAASTPAQLAAYSLQLHPLTGLSPLTTLRVFLVHAFLSSLITTHPSSPTPSFLLRASLESLYSDLSASLALTTTTLRQQPALREQQQQLLGLFKALDLTLKQEKGEGRQALLWSVLRANLYGAAEGEVGLKGYELEVRTLASWLEDNWERLCREAAATPASGKLVKMTPVPQLREESRAEAEAAVRYVAYRLETVEGVDRIVRTQHEAAAPPQESAA